MGYPVRINLAFSLIESAPACSVHQVSKLVCINSPGPAPRCCDRRPPGQHQRRLRRAQACCSAGGGRLAAAPAAGQGLQEHRHPSFAALAPEIGCVGGDWKKGPFISFNILKYPQGRTPRCTYTMMPASFVLHPIMQDFIITFQTQI